MNKKEILTSPFFIFRTFIFVMNKFPKKERLNSKIKIEYLFQSKNHFIHENIKVYWNVTSSEKSGISILISVPKRIVPLATNRNQIKRLLRESYRLNKHILVKNNKELHLSFIYLTSEIPEFNSLEKKIKLILHRLNDEI